MSESPENPAVDTAQAEQETQEATLFGDLKAALAQHGNPPEDPDTQEPVEAVDASEVEETPAAEEADKGEEPPAQEAEVESEAESSVNFDGFSEDQKTTWKRLYDEGHATKEEVERARIESMFHANYTQKTMTLAEQRKAWEAEVAEIKADIDLLKDLRSDPARYEAWTRMLAGEDLRGESPDDEELADRRSAREIALAAIEEREREREAARAAEQAQYDQKVEALRAAAVEAAKTLGVSLETMSEYCTAEAAKLPDGVDPVLVVTPEELQDRVARYHEYITLKRENELLRKKAGQITSENERASKASLAPARAIAPDSRLTGVRRLNAELGLEPGWANVVGFGNRPPP